MSNEDENGQLDPGALPGEVPAGGNDPVPHEEGSIAGQRAQVKQAIQHFHSTSNRHDLTSFLHEVFDFLFDHWEQSQKAPEPAPPAPPTAKPATTASKTAAPAKK